MDFFKPGPPDECWEWQGPRDRTGYGVITDDHRKQIRAHRIAYEQANGPLQTGVNVLHKCDNPPCCNPLHLFAGTIADNNADKLQKGRQTKGEDVHLSVLSEVDVRAIRVLLAQGLSNHAIASKYGVSDATVWFIATNRTWKHVK